MPSQQLQQQHRLALRRLRGGRSSVLGGLLVHCVLSAMSYSGNMHDSLVALLPRVCRTGRST